MHWGTIVLVVLLSWVPSSVEAAEWLSRGQTAPAEGVWFSMAEAQRAAKELRDYPLMRQELELTKEALGQAGKNADLGGQEIALMQREVALLQRELDVERQMRKALQEMNGQLLKANEQLVRSQQVERWKVAGGLIGVIALVILGGVLF